MSDLQTTWGYKILDTSALTDFLTSAEFATYTNSKFGTDSRISANIPSATRSMQNYCGWHIYPNLQCEMVYLIRDLRDSFVGNDLLIQLPSACVTSVDSILLDAVKDDNDTWTGTATTDFDIDSTGLLRVFDIGYKDRRSKIRVVFRSGIDSANMDVLKALTANRVIRSLSSSYGVSSESAGGVSITYGSTASGGTGSTSLPDHEREVLESYRVKGVF